MYRFLAMRIHEGFMKLADVPETYRDRVLAAYEEMYGEKPE